jgi:hypothetical protein
MVYYVAGLRRISRGEETRAAEAEAIRNSDEAGYAEAENRIWTLP